jgi:hypothetical protein
MKSCRRTDHGSVQLIRDRTWRIESNENLVFYDVATWLIKKNDLERERETKKVLVLLMRVRKEQLSTYRGMLSLDHVHYSQNTLPRGAIMKQYSFNQRLRFHAGVKSFNVTPTVKCRVLPVTVTGSLPVNKCGPHLTKLKASPSTPFQLIVF